MSEFEFDLRMAVACGEGYYVTRWDRAKSITVRAATEREAASKAARVLGPAKDAGLSSSIRPYWTWHCDAIREVAAEKGPTDE